MVNIYYPLVKGKTYSKWERIVTDQRTRKNIVPYNVGSNRQNGNATKEERMPNFGHKNFSAKKKNVKNTYWNKYYAYILGKGCKRCEKR